MYLVFCKYLTIYSVCFFQIIAVYYVLKSGCLNFNFIYGPLNNNLKFIGLLNEVRLLPYQQSADILVQLVKIECVLEPNLLLVNLYTEFSILAHLHVVFKVLDHFIESCVLNSCHQSLIGARFLSCFLPFLAKKTDQVNLGRSSIYRWFMQLLL